MRLVTAALLVTTFSIFHANCQRSIELDSLNAQAKRVVCIDAQKFDSLSSVVINEARTSSYQKQLGDALLLVAYSHMCTGEQQKAVDVLGEALALFEAIENLEGRSKALNYLVSAHTRLSQIDSAFYYSKRERAASLATQDTTLIAAWHVARSSLHSVIAQNDSIIYYAIQGLDFLGETENDNVRGALNISVGNAYYQNEDFEMAVKYFRRASNFFDEESLNMGRIYHNLAACFTPLGQYDSSFYYFDRTIKINERLGRKMFLAFNYQALAHNFAQAGDCQKSIEYNLKSLKMSDELGEKRSRAGVLANMTECYLETGQVGKAVASAQEAVKATKESGDVDKQADAYFLLSDAYRAQGRYREAYEAHKDFYSLDSLLLNRSKQTTIAALETEYETERKEAEIESLSQQAAIQELEIDRKNQWITISLVAFVFIVVAFYLVSRQREIKKSRQQTELEQRFLRSQLNPHFISNALVAVQSFMLKNDSESAALYLTKFSKLMREILENSRKEFIPVEEEINMLTNYLDIHKLRLNESFDYSIHIDDLIDPEVDTIPPMFVQPFVENSIEHGISKLEGAGRIDLSFKKEGDYIAIEVRDNGGGLATEAKTSDHISLSSTIIRERMELFNRSLKTKIQLVLDEIKGSGGEIEGTKVELKVPFSYI